MPILYNFSGYVLVLSSSFPVTLRLNIGDHWQSPLNLEPDLLGAFLSLDDDDDGNPDIYPTILTSTLDYILGTDCRLF